MIDFGPEYFQCSPPSHTVETRTYGIILRSRKRGFHSKVIAKDCTSFKRQTARNRQVFLELRPETCNPCGSDVFKELGLKLSTLYLWSSRMISWQGYSHSLKSDSTEDLSYQLDRQRKCWKMISMKGGNLLFLEVLVISLNVATISLNCFTMFVNIEIVV